MKHALLRKHSSLAVLVVLLLSVLLSSGSVVMAATVLPVQNASADPENSLVPRAAQDPDGNLHVVWDTNVGSRQVAYRKGVWNGSGYTFGQTHILADVGGFGYSSPAIAVAPNGTVLAAWSNQFQLYVRSWNSQNAQPGGTAAQLFTGFDANIGVDAGSRFHIVANGDFQVQYCEWENGSCRRRDSFGQNRNARPDVAVDSTGGVHVVTAGGGVNYFSRPAGGSWSNGTVLGGGNAPQIAADGQGGVHAVWSEDYNIQYCRVVNGACTADRKMFDVAGDLSPTIAATQAGNLVVAFYDKDNRRLWINTRENGNWSATADVANAAVPPDITSRPYNNRSSIVWSLDYDIHVATAVIVEVVPPKFTGRLTINGGATTTTVPQVTVDITNTSGTAVPTAYSIADGADPGTPNLPFTNPTTSRSFTLDIADGRCRVHTVNAKLGSPEGQSTTFSSTIVYDSSAEATVQVRNPNLPFNPNLNDYLTAAVPSGDIAYTRRPDFNTGIWNAPNECSGLAQYALVKRGQTLAATDWRPMPAEGFVSAFTAFTPNLPTNGGQGSYQFDVYVEDKLGNKSPAPYVVTITYDVTAPTVQGGDGALPTTHSARGGVAFIDTGSLTVDDNLYVDPASGQKYWGYWVVVKKDSAGAPTETDWNVAGSIQVGKPANTLLWKMANSLVGGVQGFTPGAHTVYLRYLDGAGNWSNTVASQSIEVNQLEFFNSLPLSRR